jgi:plastocyanin
VAQMIRSFAILCGAGSAVLALGCVATQSDNAEGTVIQASNSHTEIHTEDDCDPVTFGALCRPGFPGTTTLNDFLAQLNATHEVQGWEYGGGEIRVNAGQTFRVNNPGGETHTFSVVANFGGGRVPPLNVGNPTVAPECVAGPNATNVDIATGGGITVTTGASGTMKTKGTFKVQCCIHPWMRTTVRID